MDSQRPQREPLGATVHAPAAAAVRAALPAPRPPFPAPHAPSRPSATATATATAKFSNHRCPPFLQKLRYSRPVFHIGGGGIFFWWQTGMLRELRGLERFALCGASAGALAATLAACGVDPAAALDRALALAQHHRVFERPLGLVGVWGGMVRTWLDELLPEDCHERCWGRVEIVVTQWPWLRRWILSEFKSKQEVVEACMASVHVPLLLDGRLTAEFRGQRVVDGALLDAAGEAARLALGPCSGVSRLWQRVNTQNQGVQAISGLWGKKEEQEHNAAPAVLHLRCSHDTELARRGLGLFRVRGIEDVRAMMELGAAHGRRLGAALEGEGAGAP